MKRIAVIVLLLLSCNLMGCNKEEIPKTVTESKNETTEEFMFASADAVSIKAGKSELMSASGDAVSVQAETLELEEQLAILGKARKQWLSPYITEDGDGDHEDRAFDFIDYTVTDLNQNGQLEIVTYVRKGFYEVQYYVNEVMADGTVKEWSLEGKGEICMDICADMMTVYYNEEEDTYSYKSMGSIGGSGWCKLYPAAIQINGMTIKEKYVGCHITSDDVFRTKYWDENDEEITEKEYDKLVAKATPQGKKGYAYFHWEYKSLEELLALSEQEMKEELTELSRGFLIRFEQKENEDYKKQVQYLVAQKKEWMKMLPKTIHIDDETKEASYRLMVMDLDQDGCMELGIQQYEESEMLVLEVSKEADSLTEWSEIGEKEMPDFSSVCAYRSSRDASIHFVSSSTMGVQTLLTESVLSEGKVQTKQISSAIEEVDENYQVVSESYYDGENKKITEQEYHDIEKKFYEDLTPMKLYVEVGDYFDYDKLEEIADEELEGMLQEGIESFLIG